VCLCVCGVVWCGVVWCGVMWCGVVRILYYIMSSYLIKPLSHPHFPLFTYPHYTELVIRPPYYNANPTSCQTLVSNLCAFSLSGSGHGPGPVFLAP
jgi:hypothetical protein